VKDASLLLMDPGHVSLGQGNVTSGQTLFDPCRLWGQGELGPDLAPGMVSRQAREVDRVGRGRMLWMHGSHRKEQSRLRPGEAATRAGAFSSRDGTVAILPSHVGDRSWCTPSTGAIL
jgi:hypothetical protein